MRWCLEHSAWSMGQGEEERREQQNLEFRTRPVRRSSKNEDGNSKLGTKKYIFFYMLY